MTPHIVLVEIQAAPALAQPVTTEFASAGTQHTKKEQQVRARSELHEQIACRIKIFKVGGKPVFPVFPRDTTYNGPHVT